MTQVNEIHRAFDAVTLQALRFSECNRADQHAYWINLCNAGTVQVVLTFPPP